MLALGIILILLAAFMVYVAFAGATDQTAVFDLGAFNLEMNTPGVFVAGGATVLVLVLGLALLRSGLRSASRRRKEKKELKRLHAREDQGTHAAAGTGAAATTQGGQPGTGSAGTAAPTTGSTTGSTHGGTQGTQGTTSGTGGHTHRDGTVTDR